MGSDFVDMPQILSTNNQVQRAHKCDIIRCVINDTLLFFKFENRNSLTLNVTMSVNTAPETITEMPYIANVEIEGQVIESDGAAIIFNNQVVSCRKSGTITVIDGRYTILNNSLQYDCSVAPWSGPQLDTNKSINETIAIDIEGFGSALMFYGGLITAIPNVQFEKYNGALVINNGRTRRVAHLFCKRGDFYVIIDASGKYYGTLFRKTTSHLGSIVATKTGYALQKSESFNYESIISLSTLVIIAPALWYLVYNIARA